MNKRSLIYPGAKVAVMGLGISGRAAVRYAHHCGAEVAVSDTREESRFLREEAELLSAGTIAWEAGRHSWEFLKRYELILVSPGINGDLPLLEQLRDAGIKVVGEFAVVAGELSAPIVAVTGTNGKTTVTTLIGQILAAAGKRVFVGGNIGTPLYQYLLEPERYDVVVAEVSSFQLENAGKFTPTVGVLLNISPDHLDRHSTLERYLDLKMRLFAHQQDNHFAIVYGDDPLCRQLPPGVRSTIYSFGVGGNNEAVIGNGCVTLTLAGQSQQYLFDGAGRTGSITGKNYAAAILATKVLGCDEFAITKAIDEFQPLPHRIEFVADVNGVSYYNDSKATNTGAVIAALEQFADNVVLIAGGRDKGDDFRLLRTSVVEHVRKVVVFGEAAGLIEDALADIVTIIRADSMKGAVLSAARCAQQDGVVLLSPGCASFDMFRSYGHRGDEFKKEVLALQAGGM